MNKAQMTEMKAIIRTEYEAKIKKLKEEMEDALSSLLRVEKTLIDEGDIKIVPPAPAKPPLLIKRKRLEVPTTKTALGRIMNALQEMNAEFSSGELKEKANNDGNRKEIKRGTFAGIFAHLIKTGKIIVVQERKGNQGGLYIRIDQGKTQSESSPDIR